MDVIVMKAKITKKTVEDRYRKIYEYLFIVHNAYMLYVTCLTYMTYRENMSSFKGKSKSSSYRGLILSKKIFVWGCVQTKGLEQCKNSSLHKSSTSFFKRILMFLH